MSKTKKELNKYLGYKFFKETEVDGEFEVVRVVSIKDFNDTVTIINDNTNQKKDIKIEQLKGYTPLKPYGMISFANVTIDGVRDVIVALYRLLDLELDINEPYAICRQGMVDFFNVIATGKTDTVGVCCSRDNCPANIPYENMAICDSVEEYNIFHIYYDDTLDSILDVINTSIYDKILKANFIDHMNSKTNGLYIDNDSKVSDNGWCKNLHTLLTENNFITDMDSMRNIVALDFKIEDCLVDENDKSVINDIDFIYFFRTTFKVMAEKIYAVKYWYDVDLAEFNNSNYVLLRSSTGDLYIVVYTVSGEYLEEDLKKEATKLSCSEKFRLAFYDKYNI